MPKFSVEKCVGIEASPEKVHEVVRDFRQWPAWSPWLIAEPDCELSFGDDGRSFGWNGKIVGSGSIEITGESDSPGSIDYRLTFLKPWKSISAVQFLFQSRDGGTGVTWSMEGSLPFFLFWMKPMMSAYIGMDYQRGLNMLKDYVETGSVPSKLEFCGGQTFAGFRYVGVKTSCALADIGTCMENDFDRMRKWFESRGLQPACAPFSIYHKWNLVRGITEYTVAFPVETTPADLTGVIAGELPCCDVYVIRHIGSYRHLGNAWAAGMFHARSKVFRQNKKIDPFEVYENDPSEVAENELVTVVQFPAR